MTKLDKLDKIAKKLRQARIEAAFSQKALAGALKLSDRTISAYEKGRAMPPLATLQNISNLITSQLTIF
jgi:transcriptional regulator with XRE-family HTH domain